MKQLLIKANKYGKPEIAHCIDNKNSSESFHDKRLDHQSRENSRVIASLLSPLKSGYLVLKFDAACFLEKSLRALLRFRSWFISNADAIPIGQNLSLQWSRAISDLKYMGMLYSYQNLDKLH